MSMLITSAQNPRVKAAARLRDRRGRTKQGRIIIDGVREVSRAFAAGVKIVEMYVCRGLLSKAGADTSGLPASQETDVLEVSPAIFGKIAFGERQEGVVAVAEAPDASLGGLAFRGNPVVGVLEGVEKPGNLGAVLRTADAAGLSALIVAGGGTDLYNPNAIRASLGAIFTLPVAAGPTAEVLAWLRERDFRVLAARVDGEVAHTDASFKGRCAIALGSEAEGLTGAWNGAGVTAISLPMRGKVDSLNVSTAAAVLFYEALRQRTAVS